MLEGTINIKNMGDTLKKLKVTQKFSIYDLRCAFDAGRKRISHPDWDHEYDSFEDYCKEHGL